MTYLVGYMCVACHSLRMVNGVKNMHNSIFVVLRVCVTGIYYQPSVTSEGAYHNYLIVKDGRLLSIVNELNMTNG
jgi:hypothetical protein